MRPAEIGDRVGEVMHRNRLDARQRHLPARLGGAHQPRHLRPARAFRGDQRPGHRPHAAVERELAERRDAVEGIRRQLVRRGEDRQRDRQVEARSLLAQSGGCEVDGDAPHGKLELSGRNAAPHPFLRLLAGAVCETDDRERRPRQFEAGLDLDPAWLEPDERVSDRACNHVATLGGKA